MDQTDMQGAASARPARAQRTEGTTTETNGQVHMQASAELVHTYSVIANAITATLINAQAGLDWLNAQQLDLDEVRQSLNSIANDSKRAGEVIVRLRALMKNVPTAE